MDVVYKAAAAAKTYAKTDEKRLEKSPRLVYNT